MTHEGCFLTKEGLFGIGLLDEMYFYKGNNFLGVADWQKLAGNAKTITSGKNRKLLQK